MTTQPASAPLSAGEARRAARNAGAIAAARILSSAALFAWQLVLAPWLGVSVYGIYGTVASVFAIAVPVASFGMGMMIIRDVARRPERAGDYLSAALFMQTILAGLAYLCLNAAALLFGYDATVRAFAALAGLSLFIDLLGSLCFDQLLAQERMVTTSAVEVGHVALRIGLAAGALALGLGLAGVYLATLTSGVARSIALWMLLRRTGVRPRWPVDRGLARLLLVNSAPLALTAFLSLAYQHIDKLMTASLIGTRATGYLTAAFVVIYGVVEILSTTVLIATYPLMSRAYGEGGVGRATFEFIVRKLAFFTLLIVVPLALTVVFFAHALTLPLFGADFQPTADVLRVLIVYAGVTMVANVFAQALLVQNRQRRLLAVRALGLGCNIGLNALLLPRLGVIGAAAASVCAETLVLALLVREHGAPGLRARALRLLVLAGLTALAMAGLGGLHPAAGIVGGLTLYTVGVLRGGVLAGDDWDLLYRLLAAMPGGGLLRRVWPREVSVNW